MKSEAKKEQAEMSIPSIYDLAVKTYSELGGIYDKIRELTYGPSPGDEEKDTIAERGSLQELYHVLDKTNKLSEDIRRDLNNLI